MVKVCSSLLLDRGDARVLDPAPLMCVDEVVVLWCIYFSSVDSRM